MCRKLCSKVSSVIVGGIEEIFYRHGERIARHPWLHIAVVILVVLCSTLGFFRFRQEKHPLRLWIPEKSDFLRDTSWLMDEIEEGFRVQSVLITAPDVLQPDVLSQLLKIHTEVHNIALEGATWEDVCFKVPIISFNTEDRRRRRRQAGMPTDRKRMMEDESFDPSNVLGTFLFCSIVRNMKIGCYQHSVLDLWKYDHDRVSNLTKADVLSKLNTTVFSPVLGHPMNYISLLGGVTNNETGDVVSAKALLSMWMVRVNFSAVDMDKVGNQGGTADWANGPGLEWEGKFLDILEEASHDAKGMQVFYEAGRSFGDISAAGMFQDIDKLMVGVTIMLLYVQMLQTERSWVTSRVIPGAVGLLCVGLAFVSSCGICSLLGIPYGPVHTSLPFLLLGIGVDDMFVILSCWNGLPDDERQAPLSRKLGLTMRHAGLSITVTSATDFVAFAIGSLTILPSLKSFCLYAAMGVFLTYLLQVCLFVPALALDEQRLEAGRNCIVPCLKHAVPKPGSEKKQSSYCNSSLNVIYSRLFITKFGKIVVLLISMTFLAFGILGLKDLRQEFDPKWFLDQDSHLVKFLEQRKQYFPDLGNTAGVYLGRLNYSAEIQNIGTLVENLKNQTDILKNVDEWYSGFGRYVRAHFSKDISSDLLTDEDFHYYLSKYLFSPSGSKFQKNFRFHRPLVCGEPAPNITISFFEFVFVPFEGPEQHLPAMNRVKQIVKDANFTTGDRFGTVWGKVFANWVTDEVIAAELYRNLILAMICVGVTTTIFLSDFAMSTWVLLCVLLTMVDVMGFMHFWGLTIDLVSCIALVLAVGLCVDFAAHVGYAFLSSHGSRKERAVDAVVYIGGAVMHGGATTLLALSVLVFSNSYIFKSFFKIFLLVILLGLFHGLVLLPVILSILGPRSYSVPTKNLDLHHRENDETNATEIQKFSTVKLRSEENAEDS